MSECTWEKDEQGQFVCMAEKCHHWLGPGKCALGKVSLLCSATSCKNNVERRCKFMNVILGEDGKCQTYLL